MEDLNPALILLWDCKRALEKGRSVGSGIEIFLGRKKQSLFSRQTADWWRQRTHHGAVFDKSRLSPHRRHLFEILEAGLQGHTIGPSLQNLEHELIAGCEREIQNHIALLPLISLGPLLFLVFPSLMILIIAPLLRMLQF